jgi:hypothetical protein
MSPQAGFLLQDQIVPRLCSAIPKSILCVGAEDHHELIQDATVMAAQMLDRVERQGKLGRISPGNIAYYTLQHLKSGRRANGTSSVDIMGSSTQLNGNARLHSMNEVVSVSECGDEIFELQDVISQDNEDPAVKAARSLDWGAFIAGLNKIEKLVVEFLSSGKTLRQVAQKARLTDSTMQYYRKRIAQKIVEFMGIEILRDIAQLPGWRIGLDCERELMACRAERRH